MKVSNTLNKNINKQIAEKNNQSTRQNHFLNRSRRFYCLKFLHLKVAAPSAIDALTLSNVMLLNPEIGSGFVDTVFTSGCTTPIYHYSPILLFTLEALTPVNFKDSVSAFDFKGVFASFTDKLQAK
jgi:hypothetical protein